MRKQKRNLFEELKQGIDDFNAHQKKKMTLRTHKAEKKPIPLLKPAFILETRKALNMSRNLFALRLRVSPRTLEKWEQGKTRPNDQAAALIMLVNKYPETLNRLKSL